VSGGSIEFATERSDLIHLNMNFDRDTFELNGIQLGCLLLIFQPLVPSTDELRKLLA
jgi:hypothetical protein